MQLLFISGLTLIIGPTKTLYFFARKHKLRGTICFLGGIVLIFLKWPVVGICVEVFGIINLFGDFFPVVLGFSRQLPFIGPVLRGPYIGPVSAPSSTFLSHSVPPYTFGVSFLFSVSGFFLLSHFILLCCGMVRLTVSSSTDSLDRDSCPFEATL